MKILQLDGQEEELPEGFGAAILKLRPGLRFLNFKSEGSSYFPDLKPGAVPVRMSRGRYGKVPLPDDSLDRLLAAGVFEAMEGREAFLAEARRLLSPGGLLCLIDKTGPGGESAVDLLRQAGFAAAVSHADFDGAWCLTAVKGLLEG